MKEFRTLLEHRILEFDHLTEEEQRERGLLLPDETYEKKIRNVSSMGSEKSMRSEAKKCQLLCCKCHLEITIEREKCITPRTKIKQDKMNYINNLKIENEGCSVCGFFDENLLRFFDFDHLNPEDKMTNISSMIQIDSYSLEDVKSECDKCRIICKHCHKIHTSEQRKQGLL